MDDDDQLPLSLFRFDLDDDMNQNSYKNSNTYDLLPSKSYLDINSLMKYNHKIIEENTKLKEEIIRLHDENKLLKKKSHSIDLKYIRDRNRARCRLLTRNKLLDHDDFTSLSKKIKDASTERDCLLIIKKRIEKKHRKRNDQYLPLNQIEDFYLLRTEWEKEIKEWSKDD